jgi:ketosteroid isomerase-like protein
VSQENVDLVTSLQPDSDEDVAQVFRDDKTYAAWVETHAALYHPDCEFAFPGLLGAGKTYTGLEGGRAVWVDWLTPWTSYRVEVSETIDCGERVLALYDAFAVPQGSTAEVKLSGADVWTVRDGKIARWEGYGSHAKGRKVVGLEGG